MINNNIKFNLNLKFIISIFFIISFLFLLYEYKKHHDKNTLLEMSDNYYNLIKSMEYNDITSTKLYALKLYQNKETIYYDISCLFLSKVYIKKQKYKKAKYYLKNILRKKNPHFYDIANIRLINILIYEKKYNKALNKLNKYNCNNPYNCIHEELKGDIYYILNDEIKTNIAYMKAIKNTKNPNHKYYLELKLKNLKTIK